jgi:predicted lipoprotein with Yx(FWY)xxD motif
VKRWAIVLWMAATALGALAFPAASAVNATVPAHAVVEAAYNPTLKKTIIVDSRGFTLYMYSSDSPGQSACYNDPTYHCSKVWPPLLTKAKPQAGKGAKASLLGTIKRTGGGLQVTYKGHPLYTNAGAPSAGLVKDAKPGDVHGQRFLEVWWALTPAGARVTARP